MFLKFRYLLGYEALCREVSDSITWRRFCRIPIEGRVPHPTTLRKLTARCGSAEVEGLKEAMPAQVAGAKLPRTNRVRVGTTAVPSDVAYPTDSGLLAKAIGQIAATTRRIQAAGGAVGTKIRTDPAPLADALTSSASSFAAVAQLVVTRRWPRSAGYRRARRSGRGSGPRRRGRGGQCPARSAPSADPGPSRSQW